MTDVNHRDGISQRLIRWADQQPDVRAMVLTSTREVPNAAVDELSDHDVILVVHDIHPYVQHRDWLRDFGDVLVAYWDPIEIDEDTGVKRSVNVIQYVDGHKIDFTLWPVAQIERLVDTNTLPAELDAGYRVLLDKMDKPGACAHRRIGPTSRPCQTKPPTSRTSTTSSLVHPTWRSASCEASCKPPTPVLTSRRTGSRSSGCSPSTAGLRMRWAQRLDIPTVRISTSESRDSCTECERKRHHEWRVTRYVSFRPKHPQGAHRQE